MDLGGAINLMARTRRRLLLPLAGGVLLASAGQAFAQAGSTAPWQIFLLLFVVLAVVCWPICAWFILTGRAAIAVARASQSWPTAPGTVLASEVDTSLRLLSKNRDYKHVPTVRYAYEVAGKRHEGDVIQFGLTEAASRSVAEQTIKPYPVGGKVKVFYDPQDPTKSVLETSEKAGRGRVVGGWILTGVPFVTMAVIWVIVRYV